MYTEAAIEFFELKIVVLRVAYSIREWAMKIWYSLFYFLLVHLQLSNKKKFDSSMLSLSVAVPGLVLYVLLLHNAGPST